MSVKTVPLDLDPQIDEAISGPFHDILAECVRVHRDSYLAPIGPFPYPWFDIGPGYQGSPAFGHWDIVHECFNVLPFAPEIVRQQVEMYLSFMDERGMLPGVIWGPRKSDEKESRASEVPDRSKWRYVDGFRWSREVSHPPMWSWLVDDYFQLTGDKVFLSHCLQNGLENLGFWRNFRRAKDGGYFYIDILERRWESGVDDGVRFLKVRPHAMACIDATSHVVALMKHLQSWANILGRCDVGLENEISSVESFVRNHMWDRDTGFFYDIWIANSEKRKVLSFEGFFPLLANIATERQADLLVGHLLNKQEFYTYHPVATVSVNDPEFRHDMWRGPAWNSMTYWILRGLLQYGFDEAVSTIASTALLATQKAFRQYGCLFEFYNSTHPDQSVLWRKGNPAGPCRDYLGHSPLIAMANLLKR